MKRRMLLEMLLLAVVNLGTACGAAAAQEASSPDFPDTLAGRRMQAFFEAYAAGTDDALRGFQEDHGRPAPGAVESRIASGAKFRARWGVLTPRLILFSDERRLNVLAENVADKTWMRCELLLEKDPPHWFGGIGLYPATGPELYIQSHDTQELAAAVRRFQVAAEVPALAVGTIRGDVIQTAVAGTRRLGEDEPVAADDRFHLGSITKSITATVIGRLIEQERVDWDNTLGELLPDIEMRPEYRDVTVEELLQHRAGLPFFPSTHDFRNLVKGSPGDERVAFAAAALQQLEPVVQPRQQFQYSNAGYAIAGLIAERVSDRTWEELAATEIFAPLGMSTAGLGWPAIAERPDQPWGHQVGEDGVLRPQQLGQLGLTAPSTPSGDVHCSIEDFARFAQLHLQGIRGRDGVLRAATIQRLHRAVPVESKGFSYAAGWFVEPQRAHPRHGHGGSAGWFLAEMFLEPDSNIGVVVAANQRSVIELRTIADSLLDWLRSQPEAGA